MNKQNVISFFDRLAPQWDATTIRNDAIIDDILDHAAVGPHVDVLDVACGESTLRMRWPNQLEHQSFQ